MTRRRGVRVGQVVVLAAVVLGLVLWLGPYIGLGQVLEQFWSEAFEFTPGVGAEMGMSWGIRPSDQPAGSIVSVNYNQNLEDGQVTIYATGKLTVTGAQTVGSQASFNVKVVQKGSTTAVSSTLTSGAQSAALTDKGGGTWEASISHSWDYLGYADLGIPNVNDYKELECYVYVSVTVDGSTRVVQSWSTTSGGKALLDVKHTSDGSAYFTWSNPQIYYS